MAKISIVSALNQISIETPSEKEVKNLFHPLYGLKDTKGWLTRYPKEGIQISREWLIEYLQAGGNLDSQGVWGVSPYQAEPNYSPKIYGHLARVLVRVDNIDCNIPADMVSETISAQDYRRLIAGWNRKNELLTLGITHSKSIMALGWMSKLQFCKFIAQNFNYSKPCLEWIKNNVGDFAHMVRTRNSYAGECQEGCELVGLVGEGNGLFNHYINCKLKHVKRRAKLHRMYNQTFPVHTLRMFKYICTNGRYAYKNWNLWANAQVRTSLGYVYVVGQFLVTDFGNTHSKIRQVGGYNVCVLGGVSFVWKVGSHFDTHKEAKSVKEGIKIFEEASKIANLKETFFEHCTISAKQFHLATNSCWAGTMEFLKDTAPFLYRLFEGFGSWKALMENELSNLEYTVTPRFAESIKYRF